MPSPGFESPLFKVLATVNAGPTTMVTLTEVLPSELTAVTVYVALAEVAVGAPLITPVAALMARPNGNAGFTEKLIPVPVTVGTAPENATPR